METKLSAVIPTYNSTRFLERCLDALAGEEEVDEVLVLDGGSSDGAPERVAERPGVRVLCRPDTSMDSRVNLGFREARNEMVLLLNDDAFVDPETPRRLAEAIREQPSVAAVGAHLRFEDGREQKSGSSYRTLLHETLMTLGLERVTRILDPGCVLSPKEKGVEETSWLPLCAAVVRRSALLDIGGFDEKVGFYYDDHDFCRRLSEAGSKLAVRWDAGAVHVQGAATAAKDPVRFFGQYQKTRFLYLRKHYPRGWRLFAVAWGARAFVHMVAWRLRALGHRVRSDADAEQRALEWARIFKSTARAPRTTVL
jgi:N-acetylglucosaminyl-diphospho-decaprenol L-rhamnosyltransferase